MFEYAGGTWPSVEAKVGKVVEKETVPTFDHPDVDLWVAQEITSNPQEAHNLLFLRWRYQRGEFNADH
jgi:hypothetical protein